MRYLHRWLRATGCHTTDCGRLCLCFHPLFPPHLSWECHFLSATTAPEMLTCHTAGCCMERQRVFLFWISEKKKKNRQKCSCAQSKCGMELPQTLLSRRAEPCSFLSPTVCSKAAIMAGGIVAGFCSISYVGKFSQFAPPPTSLFLQTYHLNPYLGAAS